MRLLEYLKLMRVVQWYKNLVIFLPLVFVGQLLQGDSMERIALGFVALGLVSSANYVFNDMIDRKADRMHPEKKRRPLAAGTVRGGEAVLLFLGSLVSSLALAFALSPLFFLSVASLFALTLLYSLWLKHEVLVDMLLIGVNFVIRAIGGTFILGVSISPWLILCPFFLSLFLTTGKRKADLLLLGKEAELHRRVLKYYTPEFTGLLLVISTTLLLMSYSLYSFLSQHPHLLWTLPVALYVVFRYLYLIYHKPKKVRHPELSILDPQLLAGIILWTLMVLAVIYL